MRAIITFAGLSAVVGGPAWASDIELDVELPRISTAEYHRPYVAVWIARPDETVAANLAVWYAQEAGPEGEGETWLKDLRQWWRRIGRSLEMPVDGVSGPTRAPGEHALRFEADAGPLAELPDGAYALYVEAAREVGGREVVRLPFDWSADAAEEITVSGETELGAVVLRLIPETDTPEEP